MVWNMNSSTLYKAVERHNKGESISEIIPRENEPTAQQKPCRKPQVNAHRKPAPQNFSGQSMSQNAMAHSSPNGNSQLKNPMPCNAPNDKPKPCAESLSKPPRSCGTPNPSPLPKPCVTNRKRGKCENKSVNDGNAQQKCRELSPTPNTCNVCNQPQNPISSLLNDKDSLLIAALILILVHEKADSMLILALAFVLLT